MRYSEIDLQVEDLMWFGLDTQGCVVEFTTGGSANVPEFVCRSREDNETLENYFTNLAPTTAAHMLMDQELGTLTEDARHLASRGLFCYDVAYDQNGSPTDQYHKIAFPEKPLILEDLPDNIKRIIVDHFVSADAASDQYIHVDHAY
ncbi:MAG: hypothetical protein Q4F00_02760 [bacterium]|nr:hypothetical protein [bacterium]